MIVLTALDPEEEDVTWTKSTDGTSSPDQGTFVISEGRLTFAACAGLRGSDDGDKQRGRWLINATCTCRDHAGQ